MCSLSRLALTSDTRLEILTFENVGFQLPLKERNTRTRLFNTSASLVDLVKMDVTTTLEFYHSSM